MRLFRLMTAFWVFWLALPAWARLGGGSSYSSSSGGSSSGSGGGGGGGGSLVFLLLCAVVIIGFVHRIRQSGVRDRGLLRHGIVAAIAGLFLFWLSPYMIGLVGLIYLVLLKMGDDSLDVVGGFSEEIVMQVTSVGSRKSSESESKSRSGIIHKVAGGLLGTRQRSARLNLLRHHDPNFSMPVFREFMVLLYCQAVRESVDAKFHHSQPFLKPSVAQELGARSYGVKSIQNVIVGYCRFNSCDIVEDKRMVVAVELESNAVEDQSGVVRRELWALERKLGLLTSPPEKVSILSCPGCGYNGEFPAGGLCPQCNKSNRKGDFDWVVSSVTVLSSEPFDPVLTSSGEDEAGTTQPTVVHPQLGRRGEEFLTRHPEFQWGKFWEKCSHMFLNLQKGWSERDLTKLRPFETDSLYRTHQYWVELYIEQGRINRLENIEIEKWELSNIVLDAFYESVTARVHATMSDVTTDEQGNVLSGNPSPKRFTEYWTFIRRIGHKEAKGDGTTQCLSCGGPLDNVGQTGECGYCGTVVTRGDFGWVLSNIEQDEVYAIVD